MRATKIIFSCPQNNYTMRYISLLFIVCAFSNTVLAIGRADSACRALQEVVVSAGRYVSPIRNADMKIVEWDMDFMHRLPKIMGNADPVRYSQLLPGVQTNAEYDSGLHIYGCENSHNLVSISGVPVYNASHMLGLFSVFNASHFSKMQVKRQATASEASNCIGGIMNMELGDSIGHGVKGEIALGLMSSQGTIKIPVSKKSALTASLRLSYLNLLYGSLLKIDGNELKYSFMDANITYVHRINNNNKFFADFYTGYDNASYAGNGSELYLNTAMRWGNMLAAAHWHYDNSRLNIRQSIYFTGYKNRFHMGGVHEFKLPSQIYDFGYNLSAGLYGFKFCLNLIEHHISPQEPQYSLLTKKNGNLRQFARECSFSSGYKGKITERLSYDITLKGSYYRDCEDDYSSSSLSPSIVLAYTNAKSGNLMFIYSKQYQYLHNNGFTNMGFPVEFWYGSSSVNKPQWAHCLQLLYQKELFDNKFILDVGLYYKKMYNQTEYCASPLDFLNKQYDPNSSLLHGKGCNFGINISLNKCSGSVTGWLAYSYGRALRKFEHLGDGWFPANHERMHELNSVVAYHINEKIDVSANFVYASGVPFTAPKQFYMVNGNLITEFGEHNANRLKSYIRLDLSFNYDLIRTKETCLGLNLSLYNAFWNSNHIYYSFKVYKGQYAFRGVSFFTRMLPSVSCYYKF